MVEVESSTTEALTGREFKVLPAAELFTVLPSQYERGDIVGDLVREQIDFGRIRIDRVEVLVRRGYEIAVVGLQTRLDREESGPSGASTGVRSIQGRDRKLDNEVSTLLRRSRPIAAEVGKFPSQRSPVGVRVISAGITSPLPSTQRRTALPKKRRSFPPRFVPRSSTSTQTKQKR